MIALFPSECGTKRNMLVFIVIVPIAHIVLKAIRMTTIYCVPEKNEYRIMMIFQQILSNGKTKD